MEGKEAVEGKEGRALPSGMEPTVGEGRNGVQVRDGGHSWPHREPGLPPVVTRVRSSGGNSNTARLWELRPWPVLAAGGALDGSGFLTVSTPLYHLQRSFCLKLAGCEGEG